MTEKYTPHYVSGTSTAGLATAINVGVFGVQFDIGTATPESLTASIVALSHTHIDHIGALHMWFDSRHFFNKEAHSICLCPALMADPLMDMLNRWSRLAELGGQRGGFPIDVTPVFDGYQHQIRESKNFLRAIETRHGCPSLAWAIVKPVTKRRAQYNELSTLETHDLIKAGHDVLETVDTFPVVYTGDTLRCDALERPEFVKADTVITECTYFEDGQRQKARDRNHMHLDDIVELLDIWEADNVIITHITKKTKIHEAKEMMAVRCPQHMDRIHFIR